MNCPVLMLNLYMQFISLRCYFLYLNIIWTDTALKVSQSLYCFTTSLSHGVENYFPRLWGRGISDAILFTVIHFIALINPIQWTNAIPVGADQLAKRQKKTSCVSTG